MPSAAFGIITLSLQIEDNFLGIETFPQCLLAYLRIQDPTSAPALAAYFIVVQPPIAQGLRKDRPQSQSSQVRRKPQRKSSDLSQLPV